MNELKLHLPFCKAMLQKVRGTEFEGQWQKLFDLTSSDKRLSSEEIKKITDSIKFFKTTLVTSSQNTSQSATQVQPADQALRPMDQQSKTNNNSVVTVAEVAPDAVPKHKKRKKGPLHSDQSVKRLKIMSIPNAPSRSVGYASSKPKFGKESPRNQAEDQPKIPPLKIKLSEVFKKRLLKKQKKKLKQLLKEKKVKAAVPSVAGANAAPLESSTPDHVQKFKLKSCTIEITQLTAEEIALAKSNHDKCPEAELTAPLTQPKEIPKRSTTENSPFGVIKLEKIDAQNDSVQSSSVQSSPLPTSLQVNNQASFVQPSAIRQPSANHQPSAVISHDLITSRSNDKIKRVLKNKLQEHAAKRKKAAPKAITKTTKRTSKAQSQTQPTPTKLPQKRRIKNKRDNSSPMVSIPSRLLHPHIKVAENGALTPVSTLKKIRPWLSFSDHQKEEKVCDEMLSIECLSALFKCMGIGCSFYTSDELVFRQHHNFHLQHQPNDTDNFGCCAYCEYNDGKRNKLAEHIIEEHGADKFQCSYCFYRSYDLQIETHLGLHHVAKRQSIIECSVTRKKDKTKVLADVWAQCTNNVPGMICMICKLKFFNFTRYVTHLNSHKSRPASKCVKCSTVISAKTTTDHLKICHGFGVMQCPFCRFGTDQPDAYKNHLANKHPNKLPLYFDRLTSPEGNALKLQSNKVLALKQMTLRLYSKCIIHKSPASELIRNERNVGKLSQTIQFKI